MLFLWLLIAIPNLSVVNSQSASTVYGQAGSFTINTQNNGGISANSLSTPTGIALDTSGNLYTIDASNNRALFYPKGSTTATRVYGQLGSFSSSVINNGGLSANSLGSPTDLALDSANNLYISDGQNHRVLFYTVGSTTATRVYGQAGSFVTNTQNKGGISANSLFSPSSVFVDVNGNLYVADSQNSRVLFFAPGSTTATIVFGQPNFATSTSSPITASSLALPMDVTVDVSNNVYIVDGGNNRILFYLAGSTTATRVYGQLGSFTTNTQNNGGISANSILRPRGIIHSGGNTIYIADGGNNRVLSYTGTSTTAETSFGQEGSLTTSTENNGGISAFSLNTPFHLALDSNSNLYISDGLNNRILFYGQSQTTTTSSTQTTFPSGPQATTCFHEDTIITYNNTQYTLNDLHTGKNLNCYIPHVVHNGGYAIQATCNFGQKQTEKLLRLTGDHLVYAKIQSREFESKKYKSLSELVAISDLNIGDTVFADLEEKIECQINSIWKQFSQKYFGLNCLESIVLADGIKTSTFGNYHRIPELWMSHAGGLMGIKRASIIGDHISAILFKVGLLN